jgi:lysophospholipase L1-like esterase
LHRKIPYHTASEKFREEMFNDGLHLTAQGYDLLGNLVGKHLVNLLKEGDSIERQEGTKV